MKINRVLQILAAMIISIALIFGALSFAPRTAVAQGQGSFNTGLTSLFPNFRYSKMTFTATAQTLSQGVGGASYCTISLTGTLTAATFTISVSNDGGTTYYAAAVAPYAATITPVTTAITVSSGTGLYVFNVAGFTNFKIVTSGTFTGTNLIVQPTCTSNKGLV